MARNMVLHCEAWQAGDKWIAQCLELCVVAQGSSLEEVKANLEASLRFYAQDVHALISKGEQVNLLKPVPHYRWRLACWWANYALQWIRNRPTVFSLSAYPAYAA
ncbi:MAG: hypothetical protein IRZ11_03290 [Clostridia bacterium]|nr:hypothetical protein [Clostridia bacterium]